MKIDFDKKHLEELYLNGKTKNKKHRLQPNVVKKYIQTIDKLRAANNIEELYPIKSLNYERLSGNKKGLESVRINNKYRIEFKTKKSLYQEITICSIIDISNHYQ